MGLFKFINNKILSQDDAFGNTAPDFLGRTSGGGLFGGMNDTTNQPDMNTPANMDFGGTFEPKPRSSDLLGIFGKLKSGGFGEPKNDGGFLGDNRPPSDVQPSPYKTIADQEKEGQQQMPFFGMQNPMSNMFGMGQMGMPHMNPMMGMMSMMMQPMMQMMSMFNPFMNPFGGGMGGGMGGGGGGMFSGMGQGIRNMFGYGMPQMQMPRRLPYGRPSGGGGFLGDNRPGGYGGGPFRGRYGNSLRDLLNDGRFGGKTYYTGLNPGSGMAMQAIEPGYRNGQKGYYTDSSRNTFVVDDQYGPADYASNFTADDLMGFSPEDIRASGRNRNQEGFTPYEISDQQLDDYFAGLSPEAQSSWDNYAPKASPFGGSNPLWDYDNNVLDKRAVMRQGLRNRLASYENDDPRLQLGLNQLMRGTPSPAGEQGQMLRNIQPYTMTQDDNMAISDNSDPQGEAEARDFVQRQLAGSSRGLIGNAISRLFG